MDDYEAIACVFNYFRVDLIRINLFQEEKERACERIDMLVHPDSLHLIRRVLDMVVATTSKLKFSKEDCHIGKFGKDRLKRLQRSQRNQPINIAPVDLIYFRGQDQIVAVAKVDSIMNNISSEDQTLLGFT